MWFLPTSSGEAEKEYLVASCVAVIVSLECDNKFGLDRTDLVAMNEYALLIFSLNPSAVAPPMIRFIWFPVEPMPA